MYEKNVLPILPGNHPDPTIVKKDGKFYMTYSTGEEKPQLLIWESEDLFTWKPFAYATDALHHGIAAPELNEHNGTYYIYVPSEGTNFVLTSKDMRNWSKPIDLKIGEIDPGFVHDRKAGKNYLHMSQGKMVPLNEDGTRVTGPMEVNYKGWAFPREWDVEGYLCLESPKLFYREPYYYLVSAEGGTAGPSTSHMCVVARAESPTGPWENSPYNPLVHCDSDDETWWTKGHGTAVEDNNGQWWIIYHAYEKGHHNLGRQTVMQPLKWLDDGWFVVDEEKSFPDFKPRLPSMSDDFAADTLSWQWAYTSNLDKSDIRVGNHQLILPGKGTEVAEANRVRLLPMHKQYRAQVQVTPKGGATGALMLYFSPHHYMGVGYDGKHLHAWLSTYNRHAVQELDLGDSCHLRLEKQNQTARFFYSRDGETWEKCEVSFDVSGFQHNVYGNYMGIQLALTAFTAGEVAFADFHYDEI